MALVWRVSAETNGLFFVFAGGVVGGGGGGGAFGFSAPRTASADADHLFLRLGLIAQAHEPTISTHYSQLVNLNKPRHKQQTDEGRTGTTIRAEAQALSSFESCTPKHLSAPPPPRQPRPYCAHDPAPPCAPRARPCRRDLKEDKKTRV